MASDVRGVLDTNIFIASEKSQNKTSPNRELLKRWQNQEFAVLYSEDVLLEYAAKFKELGVSETSIKKLIGAILAVGIEISIDYFHLHHYPQDPDDVAFLLCAYNGSASHLITYDSHLLILDYLYPFQICKPLHLLTNFKSVNK